jgi:hypothetical protein
VEGWPLEEPTHRRLALENVVDAGVIPVRGEHQPPREDLTEDLSRGPNLASEELAVRPIGVRSITAVTEEPMR